MVEKDQIVYFFIYILAIIYFVILGCTMLAHHGNPVSTRGEQTTKRRMTQSVGVLMFIIAFSWLIYIPPMLYGCDVTHPVYKVLFLVCLMLTIPVIYTVMRAIWQKNGSLLRGSRLLGMVYVILLTWLVVDDYNLLPCKIGAAFSSVCIAYFLARSVKEYRIYVSRIHSEYSDTSGRGLVWSWSCFTGLAVQVLVFMVYSFCWSNLLECFYVCFTVVNAGYLCYCTCRQKPIDNDVVPDETDEPIVEVIEESVEQAIERVEEDSNDRNGVYTTIEQKLEVYCEGKLLFLNPDLTREELCNRLSISGTYLKLYFRRSGQSFYQYINTLRVEYAVKLMEEHPDLSIREVSSRSGFRTQTTFRKMFHEVMGCLPSEYKGSSSPKE